MKQITVLPTTFHEPIKIKDVLAIMSDIEGTLNIQLDNLQIPLEEDGAAAYITAAAEKLGVNGKQLTMIKMLSKALDMRDPKQFYYSISMVVAVSGTATLPKKHKLYTEPQPIKRTPANSKARPIIIGFGPAGMFAALELMSYGIKPIIFDRGKKIEERAIDVQDFIRHRTLNTESNIQFGEGGAGSFSDGKLFSRRHNNTSYVSRVLNTFITFGAPKEIDYIAKPHLGTDILCIIVRNIRNHILEHGGEIHYSSKMTNLLIADGKAYGVVINGEKEYLTDSIYLASGHSARDTYAMLHARGVSLEQRPISVGVRIEHSAPTINRMRYGDKYACSEKLGAATYSLNHTNRAIRRGVYTFCMCPGGEVVNASSEEGLLVVNGMSYSQRSSPYSNAALVVSCHPTDYPSASPLAGLDFQREIEKKAFTAGGSSWQAPAQNLMDFIGTSTSTSLPKSSFTMGLSAADMHEIVPDFVATELHVAFAKWKEEVPLFVSKEALLLGVETRTSSPVRIVRDAHYESENTKNLYPLGEGAGYTGGITSSAADAIRAVEHHMEDMKKKV